MTNRLTYIFATIILLAAPFWRLSARDSDFIDCNNFQATGGASVQTWNNSVKINSGGFAAGAVLYGQWNFSEVRTIRFNVENQSTQQDVSLFVMLMDPSCVNKFGTIGPETGKTEKVVHIRPAEVCSVDFDLPAALPHPEVQDRLYREWTQHNGRTTAYQYGLGVYSSNADLKNITEIKFVADKVCPGISILISGIELIYGPRKPLPEWMTWGEDKFFPFIDRYGQFIHTDWEKKVKSDDDLKAEAAAEEKELAKMPAPKNWTKYGGWADGPRFESTGHFYTKKYKGRWWLVDPEGCLFWSHGVVRVSPSCGVTPLDNHKDYFQGLPSDESDALSQFYHTNDELLAPYYTARGIKETFDFSRANLYRKYGEDFLEHWYDLAHRRLHSWGLNTIANSSDKAVCLMDRTVYNDRVDLASPVEGYPDWPVLEGTGGWWKFIDPFDDLFEVCVRSHLEAKKDELDDPWCLGFFVDNEIEWGNSVYLATTALTAPATQASKKVLVGRLKEKYGEIGALNKAWMTSFASWEDLMQSRKDIYDVNFPDLRELNLEIIEKYFSTVRRVFKEVAPQKLYMGCRFSNCPEFVVRVGAKYCDIMSYNRYIYTNRTFHFPAGIDMPMMIGEFHFGSLDHGMFHPGQVWCNDQRDRAYSYETYLLSALRNPYIVGTNWHQFSDQATSGRFDGENFEVGFTDICDTPYPEMVKVLRRIGNDMYKIRSKAVLEQ